MIIDAHVHINSAPNELISNLNIAGIDKAIVISSELGKLSGMPNVLNAVSKFPDRLHAVGSVSPLFPRISISNIEKYLDQDIIVGLKFYVGYQHYYPHDPALNPYLDLLEKYDRPAIFHSGDCWTCGGPSSILKFAHPLEVDVLAAYRPKLKIVIAHMGNPWIVDAAEVVYNKSNVYTDISGFVCNSFNHDSKLRFENNIKYLIDYIEDSTKILYGSDWPVSDMKNYKETVENIMLNYNSKVIENIMWKNTAKLFRI